MAIFGWVLGFLVGPTMSMVVLLPILLVSIGINAFQWKSNTWLKQDLKECHQQIEDQDERYKQMLQNKDALQVYTDSQCERLKEYLNKLPPAPGGGVYLDAERLKEFYRDD